MNIPQEATAWIYIGGIVLLVVAFEVYVFFSYISNYFNSCFTHASLKVIGISDNDQTYVDLDGKLIYRLKGKYDGIIKLRSGEHKITIYNELSSLTASLTIAYECRLIIQADMGNSTIIINTELAKEESIEDATKRLKGYNNVNLFLFFIANLLMILAVIRILAIGDII